MSDTRDIICCRNLGMRVVEEYDRNRPDVDNFVQNIDPVKTHHVQFNVYNFSRIPLPLAPRSIVQVFLLS